MSMGHPLYHYVGPRWRHTLRAIRAGGSRALIDQGRRQAVLVKIEKAIERAKEQAEARVKKAQASTQAQFIPRPAPPPPTPEPPAWSKPTWYLRNLIQDIHNEWRDLPNKALRKQEWLAWWTPRIQACLRWDERIVIAGGTPLVYRYTPILEELLPAQWFRVHSQVEIRGGIETWHSAIPQDLSSAPTWQKLL